MRLNAPLSRSAAPATSGWSLLGELGTGDKGREGEGEMRLRQQMRLSRKVIIDR